MFELNTLIVFLGAVLVLALTPGPDMLYIIARGAGQGRMAGVVSALGVGTGIVFHTLIAALGLSAVIAASVIAYEAVKLLGAAYLIYLGIKMILTQSESGANRSFSNSSLQKIFFQALVTNILNPKVALFFMAFLPQFVDASMGPVLVQFLILGSMLNLLGTGINLGIALIAGLIDDVIKRKQSLMDVQKWATGGIFIALGIRLALLERH